MIRFRVIKGGTVLLAAALVILAIVIAVILFSTFNSGDEAEPAAAQVFSPSSALIPAPEGGENEHTDEIVSNTDDILTQVLPASNGKSVLIYHTHTHEAYSQAYEGEYTALEDWRTDDNEHNIVRVGDELAALLEKRGFNVVHDTTDHEQDDLSTAYIRSMETLSSRSDEEYDLYIDLHRDAYTEGAQLTCSYAGNESAKLMVLIGKGENFEVKPCYEQNYALACALTDAINSVCPGLCRDVMVKTGRYNQHVSPNSLLIEVGNNMNTLDEALSSMPALADAIYTVLMEDESAEEIITVSYEGK